MSHNTAKKGKCFIDEKGMKNVDKIFAASAILDFVVVAAVPGFSTAQTINVPGVLPGDAVDVSCDIAAPTAGAFLQAWVTAPNTVSINWYQISGSAYDPASATYNVLVTRV